MSDNQEKSHQFADPEACHDEVFVYNRGEVKLTARAIFIPSTLTKNKDKRGVRINYKDNGQTVDSTIWLEENETHEHPIEIGAKKLNIKFEHLFQNGVHALKISVE